MGWPDKTKTLERFYPTSCMVTGFDILFFWVARMMMMGIEFMEDVPFYDVYIHALIRDEHGQKMSKTRGNVIDPLVMMERYGTDAFRFALVAFAAQGRDIRMSEKRIEGYRHFVNKIWNASRFVLMKLEGESIEGNLVSKMVVLPMGESAPGKARLEKAGLELRTEKKRVFVDMVTFNSLAQKAGIDFDWEILSLQIPTDRPAKQWMYFPALALLGLVVIRQRRRRI